ncbi:MAG: hypothetical protein K8S98_18965 [Planctomycetes bacterium]|nr:hypothetical protein [Planctomycetota bacterium]
MASATAPTQPVDLYPSTSLSAELNTAAPNFRSASMQTVPPRDSVFSYSYVEVGAIQQDPDDLGDDVEAVFAKVSLELFEIFHIFAGYAARDTDFHNTDSNMAELGAGFHFPVTSTLDLIAEGSWLFNDVDSDLASLDDKDTGFGLFAGARYMAIPWEGGGLELNGGARHIDLDNDVASDGDGTTGWEAGARLHFARIFSIGATYQKFDEFDALAGSLRLSF